MHPRIVKLKGSWRAVADVHTNCKKEGCWGVEVLKPDGSKPTAACIFGVEFRYATAEPAAAQLLQVLHNCFLKGCTMLGRTKAPLIAAALSQNTQQVIDLSAGPGPSSVTWGGLHASRSGAWRTRAGPAARVQFAACRASAVL